MKYTTTAELTSVFWGKFCLENKEWHPLTDHCADVAACFNVLLTSTILKQRFSHLAGFEFINDVQIQRLSFLAALHDVGKFNHGFQKQILEGNKSRGHVGPVLLVLNDKNLRKDFLDAIRLSSILQWFSRSDCAFQYLLATISHHGRPVTMVRGSAGKLWSRDEEKDPIEGIRTLVARAMSWFPLAFNARNGEHLLPDKPVFQHIFCGLVTPSDWLGSDTRFFPYSE